MIVEVATISADKGVLLTQAQARRRRRQWDEGRFRGQDEALSDAMKDHPGVSCSDEHPGEAHDDYMDRQEEEESVNPLFRNSSTSYATGRRQR